jgi:asparagine synthase (glutamine-hydrolysing)
LEAIGLRLRSDDPHAGLRIAPVGVYLSSGIDNAAVTGMVMHLLKKTDPNAKFAIFTLAPRMHVTHRFPGRFADNESTDAGDNDEGPIAGRTAAFVGADDHVVEVREADLVNVLEHTIWHAEQPIVSFLGAGKYLLSNFVHDKGYKVVKWLRILMLRSRLNILPGGTLRRRCR